MTADRSTALFLEDCERVRQDARGKDPLFDGSETHWCYFEMLKRLRAHAEHDRVLLIQTTATMVAALLARADAPQNVSYEDVVAAARGMIAAVDAAPRKGEP
jgi:hypothetical protein